MIDRTAVYGPVCTVVWEGRAARSPYPDCVGDDITDLFARVDVGTQVVVTR